MNRIKLVLSLILCTVLSTGVQRAAAQSAVRPLKITDAVGANSLPRGGSPAAFSPDGQSIAYAIQGPQNVAAGNARTNPLRVYPPDCDIRVQPIAGDEPILITDNTGSDISPVWSPNGQSIAFISDRDGAPRIWLWSASTRSLTRASDAIVRSRVPVAWTPDGRHLIAALLPDDAIPDESPDASEPLDTDNDQAIASTVVIYRSPTPPKESGASGSGQGSLYEHLRGDIARIDMRDGAVETLVKNVYTNATALSPNGEYFAYLQIAVHAATTAVISFDLHVVDVQSGELVTAASNIEMGFGEDNRFCWSPDSQHLTYISSNHVQSPLEGAPEIAKPTTGQRSGCFVVSRSGGAPRPFTSEPMPTLTTATPAPLWGADGESLYLLADNRLWRGSLSTMTIEPVGESPNRRVVSILANNAGNQVWATRDSDLILLSTNMRTRQSCILGVDVQRRAYTPLIEQNRNYGRDIVVSPDGRHAVFTSEAVGDPQDLWVANASFSSPRRLSNINPTLRQYTFGDSRMIEFDSHDGQPLQGALLLPADYVEGERYPMLVWVYASDLGSRFINRFGMFPMAYNMQMLATRGYAVLMPDIPVNTGTPMRDLMKCVMPAIDRVVELGIADPDRLAVSGQSNGGYSTLSLIVQTGRFKAAVMNAGFGDLTGFYGAMNANGTGSWWPWLEQLGGAMVVPPWEDPQRYVENSPIYYLDRITTPLIIQAGSADDAIVPFSDQVFVGLNRLQKNVTYLRYEGEGHVLQQYANLVDYWNRVMAFFEQHLGPSTNAR